MTRELSYLRLLEAEAIFVVREVAAEFERPVLLFSGGKDSTVLLRIAEKAFRPARFPFPVMHVDTGHNFPEVIEYRDRRVEELGVRLDRRLRAGLDRRGPRAGGDRRRRLAQPAADHHAARRDRRAPLRRGVRRRAPRRGAGAREGARLVLPRRARPVGPARASAPSSGASTTAASAAGEHVRVFPLSNWTELDIWRYIAAEELELPSIYFAHGRSVIARDGMLLADSEFVPRHDGEEPFVASVRYRTVGDIAVTGAVQSEAVTLEGRRRDRRHARDRAGRDARRRPRVGRRDGGPQARGLFLMPTPLATRRPSCCASRPRARSTTARAR